MRYSKTSLGQHILNEVGYAIALFNEPQWRREHRGKRKAMPTAGFAYAFLSHAKTQRKQSQKRAIA
ncbi:MAG: hypothetical protein V7L05_15875 [Nostoc sp.]|uniref:hypothetical protein n=1 Tax=Nostoc sp. TaxID=1180 RepID=UPI002FF969F6